MSPERFFVLVALATLVATAVVLIKVWSARRSSAVQERGPAWDTLGAEPDGRRTLIAFSTPSCAACHAAQAPAIQLATQELGDTGVRVIPVDAARRPEVARAFGILTVPSTVVIGAAGKQIVAINQGFAPSGRLLEQLRRA
jgi:hypothetical protein